MEKHLQFAGISQVLSNTISCKVLDKPTLQTFNVKRLNLLMVYMTKKSVFVNRNSHLPVRQYKALHIKINPRENEVIRWGILFYPSHTLDLTFSYPILITGILS